MDLGYITSVGLSLSFQGGITSPPCPWRRSDEGESSLSQVLCLFTVGPHCPGKLSGLSFTISYVKAWNSRIARQVEVSSRVPTCIIYSAVLSTTKTQRSQYPVQTQENMTTLPITINNFYVSSETLFSKFKDLPLNRSTF